MTTAQNLPLGPTMVGIAGLHLTDDERRILRHPMVGGVILFRRNFESIDQLCALTQDIRALRHPALLITVDHEGGRVQRFLQGFTRLPPMRKLGELWQQDAQTACARAQTVGYVLAAELRACGVDLSLTPVLDLDWSRSSVIGDRAFSSDAEVVSSLALSLQRGLVCGGMSSCGKHFPGHGWVAGDSHHVTPHDERPLANIRCKDLVPFMRLIKAGMGAVMPAHVVYPEIDAQPAGFSRVWLQDILRQELKFDGVIFSDDLGMEGAAVAGGIVERARAAFAAGCDMVLSCNRPDLLETLLAGLPPSVVTPSLTRRLERLRGQDQMAHWQRVIRTDEFAVCQQLVQTLATDALSSVGPAVGESS